MVTEPKVETRCSPGVHTPNTGNKLLWDGTRFPPSVILLFPLSHPGLDEVETGPGATLTGQS